MPLDSDSMVAERTADGAGDPFYAIAAATGLPIEPPFATFTDADLEIACAAADSAFDPYRLLPLERRAQFLEAIADEIEALGAELLERCSLEIGLPAARIESERSRTTGQLRLFAQVVRDADFLGVRITPAMPERLPLPRPDLRLRNIPLGPVAVFGASNVPLSFSVAGNDTTAALAAGCPVIVKAHPAHPGTSKLVAGAIHTAMRRCDMPVGTFSMIVEAGFELGQKLVRDHRIKAVGFTGSRRAGMALMEIAQQRPEPIPVFAEMSSINPVLLMPGALAERAEAIAEQFVASLLNGAGQFCTSPGLLLAVEGEAYDRFVAVSRAKIEAAEPAVMLTPGIFNAFQNGVSRMREHEAVRGLAAGLSEPKRAQPHLFEVDAADFLRDQDLHQEIFGSASLLVRCANVADMQAVLTSLEGQLTCSIHATPSDYNTVAPLLPLIERKVGRILFDGFGVGVEIGHSTVHGGPFPATSDGRTTSVGSRAIDRFLRPISYQNAPEELLPDRLR